MHPLKVRCTANLLPAGFAAEALRQRDPRDLQHTSMSIRYISNTQHQSLLPLGCQLNNPPQILGLPQTGIRCPFRAQPDKGIWKGLRKEVESRFNDWVCLSSLFFPQFWCEHGYSLVDTILGLQIRVVMVWGPVSGFLT